MFIAVGVPVSHVRPATELAHDAQIIARQMIKPVRMPSGSEIPSWGVPLKINGAVADHTLGVPGLNQHRDEILREIGFAI